MLRTSKSDPRTAGARLRRGLYRSQLARIPVLGARCYTGGNVSLVLALLGLFLQLVGAVTAAFGVFLIWPQDAAGGERLLDPATRAVRRSWRRLTDPVLRWIGRPRPRTVQIGGVTSVELAGSIRPSTRYPPLAADLAIRDAIAELDRRSQAIIAEVARVESRLLDQLEKQDRRHDDLSRAFDGYVGQQDEHARQRARRGVRFEAAGLALLTLGTVLQAVGQLIPV